MSGTLIGGQKAAATNKARHGADFYKNIGAKGGRNGHTGGFFANRELARIAGAIGGRISRRGSKQYNEKATCKEQNLKSINSTSNLLPCAQCVRNKPEAELVSNQGICNVCLEGGKQGNPDWKPF